MEEIRNEGGRKEKRKGRKKAGRKERKEGRKDILGYLQKLPNIIICPIKG